MTISVRAVITKVFRFEAAHYLPNHDGKCRNPHGHSYRVEVQCSGPIHSEGSKEGMVVDFADIKAIWKEQIEPLVDHRDLNESLIPEIAVTTAENIAYWMCKVFRESGLPVLTVEVWETETSSARINVREIYAH